MRKRRQAIIPKCGSRPLKCDDADRIELLAAAFNAIACTKG